MCSSDLRALAGMNAHAPEPLTVVEPRSVAPSYSASVEPATPVPAIDGVVELERRYREAIPVIEVDGAELARYHLEPAVLDAALRRVDENFVRSL